MYMELNVVTRSRNDYMSDHFTRIYVAGSSCGAKHCCRGNITVFLRFKTFTAA
jgi:hypothetical protein